MKGGAACHSQRPVLEYGYTFQENGSQTINVQFQGLLHFHNIVCKSFTHLHCKHPHHSYMKIFKQWVIACICGRELRDRGKASFSQHTLYFLHCTYHHQITSVHRSRVSAHTDHNSCIGTVCSYHHPIALYDIYLSNAENLSEDN